MWLAAKLCLGVCMCVWCVWWVCVCVCVCVRVRISRLTGIHYGRSLCELVVASDMSHEYTPCQDGKTPNRERPSPSRAAPTIHSCPRRLGCSLLPLTNTLALLVIVANTYLVLYGVWHLP
jgi:hypothetical protein